MDEAERLLVQRQIASIIDYPSVYMGGPSHNSMRKADKIISFLDDSYRLHGTKCAHATWESYHQHGLFCPTCGMRCRDEPEER